MKTLNRFIIEKLKFNKNTQIINNNAIELVLKTFSKNCNSIKYELNKNIEFKNKISKWIEKCIDKYNISENILINSKYYWDAPDPIDDWNIEFDYKGKDGSYYEFIAGPTILGFICNDIDYYYIIKK